MDVTTDVAMDVVTDVTTDVETQARKRPFTSYSLPLCEQETGQKETQIKHSFTELLIPFFWPMHDNVQ